MRILNSLNASRISMDGLEFALDLGMSTKAEIFIQPVEMKDEDSESKEKDRKEMQKILDRYPDVKTHVLQTVDAGKLVKALNNHSGKLSIDHFITGGSSDNKQDYPSANMIGQLGRELDIPLLLVTEKIRKGQVKDIGVLLNDCSVDNFPNIDLLKDLAIHCDAKMHLVTLIKEISDRRNNIINYLEENVRQLGYDPCSINTISHSRADEGLNYFVFKKDLDMIAVLNATDNDCEPVLTLEELYREVECPICGQF